MDLVLTLFEGDETEGLIGRAWLTQLELMLVWPHKSQNRTRGFEWCNSPVCAGPEYLLFV